MNFGKKGLSPIIGTVLLLILTVAAVAVIGTFVIPFVRDQLEEGSSCVDYIDYFSFNELFEFGGETLRYNCFEDNKNGVSVRAKTVESEIADRVVGFDLLFFDGTESTKVSVRDGETTNNLEMFDGDDNLVIPVEGGIQTYIYTESGKNFGKVEIYPVLSSGKMCEKTDEINLIACDGVELS
ncbi:hypothetical protein CMI47_01295 [Candidatus Pacearchaeota archaeon]|nr:hypothetical protein [Candidatus Pacearchaeota archaeon]|tara:strand:+ start:2257 stop:2802 length:546 start_codon:yes stop_codon:yes gene_type:complete